MQTARRLYLYLMSGATLVVLLVGVMTLIRAALDQLGVGSSTIGGGPFIRDQLALSGALIAVGLPTWAIHWWFAQRSVSPERPRAEVERRSPVRALYLALVLGGLLIWIASAGIAVLTQLVHWLARTQPATRLDLAGPVATLAVGGAVFAYHVSVRLRDRTLTEPAGAAAWLPRLYRYAASLAGGLLALFGIVTLIRLAGDMLVADGGIFQPSTWWAAPLAEGLAAVVVGAAVWFGHSAYSAGLWRGALTLGSGEAAARLRVAYWLALVAAGVVAVVVFGADVIEAALAELLGAPLPQGGLAPAGGPLWLLVAVPLISAVPFAAAGWLAFDAARREASESGDDERIAAARRLSTGLPSLIGLAFAGVAGSRLVGVGIELAFAGRPSFGAEVWSRQVADLLPFVLLGGLAWAWGWLALQVDRRRDEEAEARSTLRRTYVLLVLAASVLSGVSSVGVILYRLLNIALGGGVPSGVVSELSTPIGVLVVALLVALYHGFQLWRDLRLTGGRLIGTPRGIEAVAVPATTVTLVLSGPDEADLYVTLEELRHRLPPGFRLELSASAGSGAT